MIGYKVVAVIDGDLFSAMPSHRIPYKLNKMTFQPEDAGPLCVFTDFAPAFEFCVKMGDALYVCEYTPSVADFVWTPNYQQGQPLCDLSKGTALARSVTLKELLYENNF